MSDYPCEDMRKLMEGESAKFPCEWVKENWSGGASDFTIAKMTVGGDVNLNEDMILPYIVEDYGLAFSNLGFEAGQSYSIPLYKGMCIVGGIDKDMIESVTGNAQLIIGVGTPSTLQITGDFTITASN